VPGAPAPTLNVDTELLKTFLEVYRCRHFGRAAESLCVTQSAVSARIRQLEEQVGMALFTRDRNNIQPTSAGDRLRHHAENILTNWNRARMDIAHHNDERIPIVIGAVPSLWDLHVSPWLRTIYRGQRGIALSCEALAPDVLLRRLREGTVDLGFLYEAPADPALNVMKTIKLRFVMASSRPHLSAESALQRNYICVDWGAPFAAAHSQLYPCAQPPTIRIGLGRTALELLRDCGGSGYFPERMIKEELSSGALFHVEGAPPIERNAYVAGLVETTKSVQLQRLLKSRI